MEPWVLPMEPWAKRQKSLSSATRETLIQACVSVLEQFHSQGEDLLAGSQLSKSLSAEESFKPLIAEAKEAFGGKGWLKKFIDSVPDIEYENVPDREPCFRLASHVLVDGAALALKEAKEEEVVIIPDEVQPDAQLILSSAVQILAKARREGKQYLAGSAVRAGMGPELAECVNRVGEALSGKPGEKKGLIKKLLSLEPQVERVQVEGVDEPCYRIADGTGPATVKKVRTPKPTAAKGKGKDLLGGAFMPYSPAAQAKGKGMLSAQMGKMGGKPSAFGPMKGKGSGMDPMMMQQMVMFNQMLMEGWMAEFGGMDMGMDMGMDYGMGMGGMAKGSGKMQKGCGKMGKMGFDGFGKGKMGAKSGESGKSAKSGGGPAVLPQELAAEGAALSMLVSDVLTQQQGELGYVTGSVISKMLMELDPDTVNKVKGAFGGKGWLKKLLTGDSMSEVVAVPGVDEPCFKLRGS